MTSDEDCTKPTRARQDLCVTSQYEDVGPGETVEIAIGVQSPMWRPTLCVDTKSRIVTVEQVLCGQICVSRTPRYARDYKDGLVVMCTVNPKRPLKVVFVNPGTTPARVRVRLSTKAGE